eukprot:g22451.t1
MPSLPRHPGESWQLPSRYKVTELIGSGSYGSVCEAVDDHKGERQVVAIKKCKRIFEDLVDCKRILREASGLRARSSSAIDVWSPGCIYAELLGMLPSAGKSYMDRGPLFPGTSCFPLSPDHRHKQDYKYYTNGKHDMLKKIFGLLGTPEQKDVSELHFHVLFRVWT